MEEIQFYKIIFQSLLKKGEDVRVLSSLETESIRKFSQKYFLGGFILEGNNFAKNNQELHKSLTLKNRNFVMRKVIMLNDLELIEQEFKRNGIRYVLLKGVAYEKLGLFKPSKRQFRDIDILVKKEDLNLAFKTVKNLGYSYKNKLARSDSKFLHDKHQLPLMINKNKTLLELHHRVTKKEIYNECQLSSYLFTNSKNNLPNKPAIIAHLLYHAYGHHGLSSGPSFIFEFCEIYDQMNGDELDEALLNKLAIKDKYRYLKEINELRVQSPINLNKILNLLKLCTNNFKWRNKEDINYYIFSKPASDSDMQLTFKSFIHKIKDLEFRYQTSVLSFRMIVIIFYEFFRNLKRINL